MKRQPKLDSWEKRYALEVLRKEEGVTMTFFSPPGGKRRLVQKSYCYNSEFIYEKITNRSDDSYKIVAYRHPAYGYFGPLKSRLVFGRRVGVIEIG